MKPTHYTLKAVHDLKPQIREMIKKIGEEMVSVPLKDLAEYPGKAVETKLDGHTFNWLITHSPMVALLSDELINKDPSKVTALTATVHVKNYPWVITTTLEDHTTPNVTLTDEVIDYMTDIFLTVLVSQVINSWYVHEGMRDDLHAAIDESNFDFIKTRCQESVALYWDNYGYGISGVDSDGKVVIDIHNRDMLTPENERNPHKEILKRYLDKVVVLLIADGAMHTGISAPIV